MSPDIYPSETEVERAPYTYPWETEAERAGPQHIYPLEFDLHITRQNISSGCRVSSKDFASS